MGEFLASTFETSRSQSFSRIENPRPVGPRAGGVGSRWKRSRSEGGLRLGQYGEVGRFRKRMTTAPCLAASMVADLFRSLDRKATRSPRLSPRQCYLHWHSSAAVPVAVASCELLGAFRCRKGEVGSMEYRGALPEFRRDKTRRRVRGRACQVQLSRRHFVPAGRRMSADMGKGERGQPSPHRVRRRR